MTKFGRRERLSVFRRVVWTGLAPFIGVFLLSILDINPRDPTIFDKEYFAEYRVGGALAKQLGGESLRVESGGRRSLRVVTAHSEQAFPVKEGGYSLFWAYWPNPVVVLFNRSKIDAAVNSTEVTDHTGLLGRQNAVYKMKLKERIILWSKVLDSQASYSIGLIDRTGAEAATCVYDATCGLLFRLESHTGALGTLDLVETDFPISRNRNWQGLMALLWGTGVLFYQFLYRRRKVTEETRKRHSLENQLVLFGVMAVWIDAFYDIWFFHYLWTPGAVVIHLLAAAYVFWRFGWWGIFPLFELAWAGAIMGGQDSIVPQITFFPSLIVTWVACLLFQDFRKRLN